MAEIIENTHGHKVDTDKFATRGQNAASLSLGIIGTALGALAGGGGLVNMFTGGSNTKHPCKTDSTASGMTDADLYVERQQCQKYLDFTNMYYQDRIEDIVEKNAIISSIKDADAQNRFQLYTYARDNYDTLNNRQNDLAFTLYKGQRDANDMLAARIAEVDKKVDVMAAIRPYQDALIDSKINTNAILADYALNKRTCRMIEGQLVLPSTPVVSGYGSYYVTTNSSSSTPVTSA